ncbi:hypothetical protein EV04_1963 [Prochlorococcus marinus str. LG]|nr:hypothetical protein EV04_1963 [Prochlorococcus marinus str. LG]
MGGKIKGGHIEMHDIRWVIGKNIESTIPKLKSEWIGNSLGLHIDSYKLIQFVDGYRIKLINRDKSKESYANKLWFINLGGYKTDEMLEQHHIEIVVATSAQEAKKKARSRWSQPIKQIHKDDHASIIHFQEYTVFLETDPQSRDDGMTPDWSGYWLIN